MRRVLHSLMRERRWYRLKSVPPQHRHDLLYDVGILEMCMESTSLCRDNITTNAHCFLFIKIFHPKVEAHALVESLSSTACVSLKSQSFIDRSVVSFVAHVVGGPGMATWLQPDAAKHASSFSPRHRAILSFCHHSIPAIVSSCHLGNVQPCHPAIQSSCHPSVFSSSQLCIITS